MFTLYRNRILNERLDKIALEVGRYGIEKMLNVEGLNVDIDLTIAWLDNLESYKQWEERL